MGDFSGRSPVHNSWLALAVLMGVGGLTGLAGRFMSWDGPFAYLNSIYKAALAEPINWALHAVWPELLITYPDWLAYYIVLSIALSVLINVTWREIMGRTLIVDSFRDSGPVGGPIFLVFTTILTPVLLPLVLFIYESLNYEGKTLVRIQLKYYGVIVVVTGSMALVNLLLKLV